MGFQTIFFVKITPAKIRSAYTVQQHPRTVFLPILDKQDPCESQLVPAKWTDFTGSAGDRIICKACSSHQPPANHQPTNQPTSQPASQPGTTTSPSKLNSSNLTPSHPLPTPLATMQHFCNNETMQQPQPMLNNNTPPQAKKNDDDDDDGDDADERRRTTTKMNDDERQRQQSNNSSERTTATQTPATVSE